MKPSFHSIPPAVQGYLMAALWTEDPTPGSGDYTERGLEVFPRVTHATIRQATATCAAFLADNHDAVTTSRLTETQIGNDLWLSRNGHGSGFFDWTPSNEAEEAAFDALQSAAEKLGEAHLYFPARGPISF